MSYGGKDYTLRDAVRSLRHLPMAAEFREKYEYLNLGYMVVQHIIETTTGKPIEDSHRKYIWDSIGMSSTFISLEDARKATNPLATGYTRDMRRENPIVAPYVDDYPLVGGGGIISSINDLTKYLAVIHNKFDLPKSTYEELFAPRTVAGEPPLDGMTTMLYGLGWEISSYQGHALITHDGGINGFASKMLFLPEKKWGITFLTNADLTGGFVNEIILIRMLNDFFGMPVPPLQDLTPKWDGKLEGHLRGYINAREIMYPQIPDPPLSLPLPLEAYANSYHHPGFGTFHFKVKKPRDGLPILPRTKYVLHADLHRLMHYTLDFEHVSGEFFIAWIDTETCNAVIRGGLRARFGLGSNGKVDKMALNVEVGSNEEDSRMVVWFNKVR
jgi:hypothetical protein